MNRKIELINNEITVGDCENMYIEGYETVINNGDVTEFIIKSK